MIMYWQWIILLVIQLGGLLALIIWDPANLKGTGR